MTPRPSRKGRGQGRVKLPRQSADMVPLSPDRLAQLRALAAILSQASLCVAFAVSLATLQSALAGERLRKDAAERIAGGLAKIEAAVAVGKLSPQSLDGIADQSRNVRACHKETHDAIDDAEYSRARGLEIGALYVYFGYVEGVFGRRSLDANEGAANDRPPPPRRNHAPRERGLCHPA